MLEKGTKFTTDVASSTPSSDNFSNDPWHVIYNYRALTECKPPPRLTTSHISSAIFCNVKYNLEHVTKL